MAPVRTADSWISPSEVTTRTWSFFPTCCKNRSMYISPVSRSRVYTTWMPR